MGVTFVQGLQAQQGPYRKLDATAKHFAVHSGPEADRHHFDVHPSERDLYETYLPAFQALVQEGKVAAVMGAYNRVNGQSASASTRLEGILRCDWGFDGYIVSDCAAMQDICQNHKIVPTPEAAAALGVKHGTNLDCGDTYAALPAAVRAGLIDEAGIDTSLKRLMTTRMRLGMFDPPAKVPWAQIQASSNQSPRHDALARRTARESLVLLKNDGVLPIKPTLKRIAVVGHTADDPMSLLGNYYGIPAAPVTILQGIRDAAPQAQVVYARGSDLVEGREDPNAAAPIDTRYLRPAAGATQNGLTGDYFRGRALAGQPVLTRIDPRIAFRWDRNAPTDDAVGRGELHADRVLGKDDFSVRWHGQLLPPVSSTYELQIADDDGVGLSLDRKLLIDQWSDAPRMRGGTASVALEGGNAYDLRVEYYEATRDAGVRLAWRMPCAKPPLREAVDAARNAEVVVLVGGLTGDVEGEEMDVNYPGFAGGDRTDTRLPKPQRELLQALQATGTPVVAVLTTGSALAIDWAQQHVPAILLAWYPGQRGGSRRR